MIAVLGALIAIGMIGTDRASAAGEVTSWGVVGTQPGELLNAKELGVDPVDGSVYVGNYVAYSEAGQPHAFRLQKFDSAGGFEGSVDIPLIAQTSAESAVVGIAVDHQRGRVYLLVRGGGFQPETRATEILAYSTVPNGSEELVPASPATLPVPQGTETLFTPEEMAFDPTNHDLVILAHTEGGYSAPSAVQRISTAGSGSVVTGSTGRKVLPEPERFMAVGPDGTTYFADSEVPQTADELSHNFGSFGEVPGFKQALEAEERQGPTGIPGNYESNFPYGPQLAVSPDGSMLYWKAGFAPHAARSETTVVGFSFADEADTLTYGSALTAPEQNAPFNETCAISAAAAPIAAVGKNIVVLDVNPGESFFEETLENEGVEPEYGEHVTVYGPAGKCEHAATRPPQASIALKQSTTSVSAVPTGASVTFDPTGSDLAFMKATALEWRVDGPGGTQVLPRVPITPAVTSGSQLPTLSHTFATPGTYTVRLNVSGEPRSSGEVGNSASDSVRYGVRWAAPGVRIAVGVPAVVTTAGATHVTSAAASVGALVNPNGHAIEECKVEYGTTDSYGSEAPCTSKPGVGTSPVAVGASLTGLTAETTYHFRFQAKNSEGSAFGEDETFETTAGPSAPSPVVTAVNPAVGPAAGGTSVTITGSNLAGATEVKFGSTPATNVVVVSSTEVTATSPAGRAGSKVVVTVVTAGGASASVAADEFEYEASATPAPVITAITPTSGPAAGGTSVTITGSNLTDATEVKFGNVRATNVVVVSDTEVTATSPAGTVGSKVAITVVTAGGPSAAVAADEFEYAVTPPPVVTAINPAKGPAAGGTVVTITGVHLTGATGVKFGGAVGTSVTLESDTLVKATSPAGTAGSKVAVTVVTPSGTSTPVPVGEFEYEAAAAIPSFVLTVGKAGSGSGTVASSPAGIDCGGTCSASYREGTTVTLAASAAGGSTFAGWGGACSGTGPCVVAVNAAKAVTATFNANANSSPPPNQPAPPQEKAKPTKSKAQILAEQRKAALKKCQKLKGKAKAVCVKKANQIGKPKPKPKKHPKKKSKAKKK